MEQNFPIITKKLFNTLQLIYTMLRKGISKRNISAQLNMLMKRSKLAGKAALHSLLFFHYHDHHRRSHRTPLNFPAPPPPEPVFPIFHLEKGDPKIMAEALEIFHSATASPFLPGLLASPAVKRIRVSDSPFPVYGDEDRDSRYVDEAAEKFIMKFYRDLELQIQNSPAFFK